MSKKKGKQAGFTLLELIVVIAIMGFLVAMVAPRFAGLTEDAKEPVRDANMSRIMNAIETYLASEARLPTDLRSLAITDGAGGFLAAGGVHIRQSGAVRNAYLSNRDLTDGRELFSGRMGRGNMALHTHILNAGEARELRRLGVTYLTPYSEIGTGAGRRFVPDGGRRAAVAAGVQVLMIGSGAAADPAPIEAGQIIAGDADARFSEPGLMYRIVVGIGEESSLLEKGFIGSMGQCPGSTQVYHKVQNAPVLVLPRLAATVARLAPAAPITVTMAALDAAGAEIVGFTRTVRINEGQARHAFGVATPSGWYWPEGEHKTGWQVTGITTP